MCVEAGARMHTVVGSPSEHGINSTPYLSDLFSRSELILIFIFFRLMYYLYFSWHLTFAVLNYYSYNRFIVQDTKFLEHILFSIKLQ